MRPLPPEFCPYCRRPIRGSEHERCQADHWRRVSAMIDAAIAAGTHSRECHYAPETNYLRLSRILASFPRD